MGNFGSCEKKGKESHTSDYGIPEHPETLRANSEEPINAEANGDHGDYKDKVNKDAN